MMAINESNIGLLILILIVIVLIIYRRTHQVLFGYVLPINISTTIESWINWKVT